MSRKKINVIAFKFAKVLGGGEELSFTLARSLKKEEGISLRFFSNYTPFVKRMRFIGVKANKFGWGQEAGARRYVVSYFLFYPLNWLKFWLVLSFCKSSDKNTQNIVIFQNLNEKLLASKLARRLGYKVIWIEHLSVNPWLVKSLLRKSYISLSRNIDKIVVISQSIKNELTDIMKVDANRIQVIYNGVDVERFSSFTLEQILQKKKDMGFDSDLTILGTIGRLHSEKGFDVLIRAFAKINSLFPDTRLILIGDGPEKNNLQRLIKESGLESKAILLGHRNDIEWLVNIMDIFVLPSAVRESFGIVLIEAMAAGKVAVASNLGGIPEIVTDRDNGFLCTPGDEDDFVEKISMLLRDKDLRKKMSDRALAVVESRFSREKMIKDFKDLLMS